MQAEARPLGLAAIAMVAFAANSLLARTALSGPSIDPVLYTLLRLASGALVLHAIAARRSVARTDGSWRAGLALFVYAIAFAAAYGRIGAAVGALILFASVQSSMLLGGVLRGERPHVQAWIGMAIALAAFVWLQLPGLDRPDPWGALLMIASGAAWGIYSLIGRASTDPIGDSAGNFRRATWCCLPCLVPLGFGVLGPPVLGADGVGLALASGAVASALGYIVWYRALPGLKASAAAVLQLTVPVLTAFGAVLLLGELPTMRLVLASCLILGGVALAVFAPKAPQPPVSAR